VGQTVTDLNTAERDKVRFPSAHLQELVTPYQAYIAHGLITKRYNLSSL